MDDINEILSVTKDLLSIKKIDKDINIENLVKSAMINVKDSEDVQKAIIQFLKSCQTN